MKHSSRTANRGRRGKRLTSAATLVSATILLAACSAPAPEANSDKQSTTVTIGVPALASFVLPAVVAPEMQEFVDEGITVRTEVVSNPDALVLLATGKLDAFLGPIGAGTFNAVADGSRIAIVAPGQVSAASQWWVSKAALESLGKDQDSFDFSEFKGQAISSANGAGSYNMIGLAQLLEPSGVKLTDLTYNQIPPTDTVPALESGAVFAGIPDAATGVPALKESGAAFPVGVANPPPMPSMYLQFGARLLDEEPETGQRFINAWRAMIESHFQGDYYSDEDFGPIIDEALQVSPEQRGKFEPVTYAPDLSLPEEIIPRAEEVWRQVPDILSYDGSVAEEILDLHFVTDSASGS